MQVKCCTKCGVEKELGEFHKSKSFKDGRKYQCKECCNNQVQQWRNNNPEYNRQYSKNNSKYHNEYTKQLRQTNPEWGLEKNFKAKVWRAIKRYQTKGLDKFIPELGCNIKYYVDEYLPSKFKEGMSWKTYGRGRNKWCIDHVQSIREGGSFHYKNTQPLEFGDNISKR